MSSATAGNKGLGSSGKPQLADGGDARKKRTRKEYSHGMTEPEKFALRQVQGTQSALKTINDAIKSGKKVNPNVISLCFDLSKAAGEMLFAVS